MRRLSRVFVLRPDSSFGLRGNLIRLFPVSSAGFLRIEMHTRPVGRVFKVHSFIASGGVILAFACIYIYGICVRYSQRYVAHAHPCTRSPGWTTAVYFSYVKICKVRAHKETRLRGLNSKYVVSGVVAPCARFWYVWGLI